MRPQRRRGPDGRKRAAALRGTIAFVLLILGGPASAQTFGAREDCFVTQKAEGARYAIATYIGDRACVEFELPRTYSGIWLNEFENSRYFDAATDLLELPRMKSDTWFSVDSQTRFPKGGEPRLGHAYRVIFEGRQAVEAEPDGPGYGHFGLSSRLVLADRIVRLDDLGPR